MRNARIIVADPDTVFRQQCAALLSEQDYAVAQAGSLEEARQLLNRGWFHLSILSVQMKFPDDPYDQSGRDLAREVRALPKIMVSRFPSLDMVVELMRPGADGTAIAVNFLDKEELQKIVPVVKQAIHELINLNWELRIRLLNDLSLLYLAHQVYPAADHASTVDYADELEDLFRKLFYHQEQVTFRRAFPQAGNALVIEGFAYNAEAEERLAIFIDQPSGEAASKYPSMRAAQTTHFRALAVPLAENENIIPFRNWYPSQNPDDIRRTLIGLFQGILVQSNERNARKGTDFEQFYLRRMGVSDETLPGLDERIKALCREAVAAGLVQLSHHGRKLTLYLPQGTTIDYINPAHYVFELNTASPVLFGAIQDHLDTDSILLWNESGVRPLPSLRGNDGPLVHNLAAFELSLHQEMIPNLMKRLEAEAYLLSGDNSTLSDVQSFPPELQQVATIIELVRQFGAAHGPAYYTALFFTALTHTTSYDPTVRHTHEELTDYIHILLIAALLCARQSRFDAFPADAPGDARNRLWIDLASKSVWVEGVRIPVTPQEYNILSYLYSRAGKTCSREAVLKEALGEDTDDLFVEQNRLDSAMRRLRSKIEIDPKQPRYLLTIRGLGYQLNLTA